MPATSRMLNKTRNFFSTQGPHPWKYSIFLPHHRFPVIELFSSIYIWAFVSSLLKREMFLTTCLCLATTLFIFFSFTIKSFKSCQFSLS